MKLINDRIIPIVTGVITCLSVGFVVYAGLSAPDHNLIPVQVIIGSVLLALLIFAATFVWVKFIADKLGKANHIIFWAGLSVYLILLYIVGVKCKTLPALYDYDIMLGTAEDMLYGRPLEASFYYTLFSNNFKPTILVAFMERVALILHISDFAWISGLLSVSLVGGSVCSVRYLSAPSESKRASMEIPILVMFMLMLPTVCFIPFAYTDSFSYGAGIIGVALVVFGFRDIQKHKGLGIGAFVLAGVMIALGAIMKITSLIPVIAVVCIYLPRVRDVKPLWKIGVVVLSCVMVMILSDIPARQYEEYIISRENKVPFLNWVALGTYEDGTYQASQANGFDMFIPDTTTAQKAEICKDYIRKYKDNLLSLDHYLRKTRVTFATGNMGVIQIVYVSENILDDNIVSRCFHPYGAYYWRISQICFCYMYAMWLLIIVSSVYMVVRPGKVSPEYVWSNLSVFGFILFMFIWESQARQIYNQIPGIILCVAVSLAAMVNNININRNKNAKA